MNVVLQVYRYYFTCNTYTCVPGTGVRVYLYMYILIYFKNQRFYIYFLLQLQQQPSIIGVRQPGIILGGA
jgi:hypothetical protein